MFPAAFVNAGVAPPPAGVAHVGTLLAPALVKTSAAVPSAISATSPEPFTHKRRFAVPSSVVTASAGCVALSARSSDALTDVSRFVSSMSDNLASGTVPYVRSPASSRALVSALPLTSHVDPSKVVVGVAELSVWNWISSPD